jgi:hypothetical protein
MLDYAQRLIAPIVKIQRPPVSLNSSLDRINRGVLPRIPTPTRSRSRSRTRTRTRFGRVAILQSTNHSRFQASVEYEYRIAEYEYDAESEADAERRDDFEWVDRRKQQTSDGVHDDEP